MSDSVNLFGCQFLRRWRSTHPTHNIVFSPLSIASVFQLLHRASRGATRDELERVFGYGDPRTQEALLKKMSKLAQDSAVSIATRLFVDQSLTIFEAFLQDVGHQNIEKVNFASDPVSVCNLMNDWVRQMTQGSIPRLISPDVLPLDASCVFINALFFKGKWTHPFSVINTSADIFHGIDGDEYIPFMHRRRTWYLYKECPRADGVVVGLPYEGRRFWMWLFVPNRIDGWRKAEIEIEKDFRGCILEGTSLTEINRLKIPKWEMETGMTIDRILVDMGLIQTFSENADFGNLTPDRMFLDTAIHKAKIEVDEEGTVAAAATAVVGRVTCSPMSSKLVNVDVDRPFLYYIVDSTDGTVFFQGTQTSINGA